MTELDLLYFGALREAIGRDGERIDPPSHVLTIEDLIRWLAARGAPYSLALADPAQVRAAVDREHAGPADSFFGAQEVALFPPMSGEGAALPGQRAASPVMLDIRVQSGDFDAGHQLARLGELNATAVAGVTLHAESGDDVAAIVLEHYAAMAKAELARVAEDAGARWPLAGVILIHRHGRFAPGERLLFAGAAAAGGAGALDACRFIIEGASRRAPFWRRELLSGGGSRWARGGS